MSTWNVWDKKSPINGFSADFILSRNPHLKNEKTIFICSAGDMVTEIESKTMLAEIYKVDVNLPNEEFITAFLAEDERRRTALAEGHEVIDE